MLVILAERYHWTPEQVSRMDPDFVVELLIRIRAESEVEAQRARREKARRRRATARGYRYAEDVDLSEIE